jgi:hypothetical protein
MLSIRNCATTAVASMDTLKDAGFNPNLIVLLPDWNDFTGQ